MQSESFYDILKKSTFKEELGLYYLEDVIKEDGSITNDGVNDVNKTEKRIITYTVDQIL